MSAGQAPSLTIEGQADPAATPIDSYIRAQSDLRVVERFARTDVSGRTGRWSDLIPLSDGGDGGQYRFEVDLDSCTGCKACVTACHSLNGLDEGESFRSIGLLVDESRESDTGVAQQTVTTACHHCIEPGCLIGCPAEAYEKDPITGIVRHLDDACIGCQYCTLTCPYEVPLFNERLGIVRKCDMCADRLADGEAPACVQGCPTEAISISIFDPDDQPPVANGDRLVPDAALSTLTQPTTKYRGGLLKTNGQPTDHLDASDQTEPLPQHAHSPLVFMLVLSQWAVGITLAASAALVVEAETNYPLWLALAVAFGVGSVSAAGSFAHLGQPLKAWRVVLGWSHSWLSREAIALPVFLAAVGTAGLAAWRAPALAPTLAVLASMLGLVTVWCSVMIYHATGRYWWRQRQTAGRFFGSVALAGLVASLVLAPVSSWYGFTAIATAFVGVAMTKAWLETSALWSQQIDERRTAFLLRGPLRSPLLARLVLGLFAVIGLGAGSSLAEGRGRTVLTLTGIGVLVVSEIFERRLFFRACAPQTMPKAHR